MSKDYSQAVHWYRKAAEQGVAPAMFNVGVCHENGRGVPQDYCQALQWYRKAAEQGHANGMFKVGLCYSECRGVSLDYSLAVHWLQKAADQGHAAATALLHGLKKDEEIHTVERIARE